MQLFIQPHFNFFIPLAPESFLSAPISKISADTWALGATLYECVTGNKMSNYNFLGGGGGGDGDRDDKLVSVSFNKWLDNLPGDAGEDFVSFMKTLLDVNHNTRKTMNRVKKIEWLSNQESAIMGAKIIADNSQTFFDMNF